ncbi:PREDICTED: probable inactive poly [ADP-ribose] polymerase SRO1 [Theobroma cacao]|uniref:Probable inactive poly [ADP-ribose] polymerase SRO1 n=1 Tax=Theobroma cacao TaxID=3641 RepID=A0AB32W621_THECC|nr:PREDICTED: probable inactive poly [ADP-ribose] polymerase SRO1 [Theobroma cacao]
MLWKSFKPSISWIDENGKRFLLKLFLSEEEITESIIIRLIELHRRERHSDKARLKVFQKHIGITKGVRGTSNVVYAWYGALTKVVENVVAHGFRLPSKVPATNDCRVGVYLPPFGLPQLSAEMAGVTDDNGVKHVILCMVLLENVKKLEARSKQHNTSSVDFDISFDDPKNPKWYLLWSINANMHILSECVIGFKLCFLEKLISKIKNSFFPTKVREIMNSYNSFKAGMLANDAFLTH